MIPSFFDDQTPGGERDVFNFLSSAPDDWVIFHSLDLSPRNRGVRTEIDFILIIPDAGLLCLEVKSHEGISFDGQRWHPDSIKRSPFKQALDGRYCFHRNLIEVAPRLRRAPIAHCCIFPRAVFELRPSISIHPWELMDRRGFADFKTGADFAANLRCRLLKSIESDSSLRALEEPLAPIEIDQIIEFCFPIQRRRPDRRDEIRSREEQAERLLKEQQRPVLQLAAMNKRIVVSGGAGTGKTLIALELAVRHADAGRRVAFLCFNQLIGDWLERQARLSTDSPNLFVGRAIKVLAAMANIAIPAAPGPNFWDEQLPSLIQERFTDPDWAATARFDAIVIDEAQDLLGRPLLWECIELLLDGGFGDGEFAIFGDFHNQVLEAREEMARSLRRLEALAHPVNWRLSDNCRNYEIVGRMALALGGLSDSTYERYLRTGGSQQNYNIDFYSSDDSQDTLLRRVLSETAKLGYRAAEIALLSFVSPERSAATRLRMAGVSLRPAWQDGLSTPYASISSFKGMESKVVIITDMNVVDSEFNRNLLYVGITRATEIVRILCSTACVETLTKWMEEGRK